MSEVTEKCTLICRPHDVQRYAFASTLPFCNGKQVTAPASALHNGTELGSYLSTKK
jgi:hypothetical protein